MKLKKDDTVKIISGDDRGKTGKILKVYPRENKVLIDGVNTYKKHLKPSVRNQEGGIVTLSRPIDASKVVKTADQKVAKKTKK